MKMQKMSLAIAKGKLSRKEMKNIMAGSSSGASGVCVSYRGCDLGCGSYSAGDTIECNYCCYA